MIILKTPGLTFLDNVPMMEVTCFDFPGDNSQGIDLFFSDATDYRVEQVHLNEPTYLDNMFLSWLIARGIIRDAAISVTQVWFGDECFILQGPMGKGLLFAANLGSGHQIAIIWNKGMRSWLIFKGQTARLYLGVVLGDEDLDTLAIAYLKLRDILEDQ